MYYSFAAPEIAELCPRLMSKDSIYSHTDICEHWYTDQINEKVLLDDYPVVNCAGDAGSLKDSLHQKVFPIHFNTPFPGEDYSFSWTYVDQPQNKTKETGQCVAQMTVNAFAKHPKIQKHGPNAEATDCGTTEYSSIRLQREIYPLLLWIKDVAHCADKVDGSAMRFTFGHISIDYGKGLRYNQSTIPGILKLTVRCCKDEVIEEKIQNAYHPGESTHLQSNCGTRMSSNTVTGQELFTKHKTKFFKRHDTDNCGKSTTELQEDKVTNLMEQLLSEMNKEPEQLKQNIGRNLLDMSDLFEPEESDIDDGYDSDSNVMDTNACDVLNLPHLSQVQDDIHKSNDKSEVNLKKQNDFTWDETVMNEYDADIYFKDDLRLDISKHLLMISAALADPEFICTRKNNETLVNFWTKRPHIASIISMFCVNGRITKPTIQLMENHYNRWMELIPLIGKKYQEIHEMESCVRWLLCKFDQDIIADGIDTIDELYTFKTRIKCARLVNCTGNIPMCGIDAKEKYRTCDTHENCFENTKLDAIAHLLPSKVDAELQLFFTKFYHNSSIICFLFIILIIYI
eukprot:63484_1